MITNSQLKLARLIFDKTHAGLLPWESSPAADTYQCALPNGVIRVAHYSDSRMYISLEIIDDRGRVVDSFTDDDLTESNYPPFNGAGWYSTFNEIFELARRTALGAEQVLSKLIDDLENPFL